MALKLFIPGPTNVSEEIRHELSRPIISHRSPQASEIQKRISENLQKILFSKMRILLSSSSSTGLMEGAIRSCTAKRAAVFSCGAFGDRWYQIAQANGVPADIYSCEMGRAVRAEMLDKTLASGKYDLITITHNETSSGIQNPMEEIAEVLQKYPDIVCCVDAVSSVGGARIEPDKLGIDILITATQKALALPPGMSIAAMSRKAYERTAKVKNRGFYFDLRRLWDFIDTKNYQYTSTPCLPLMYAMDRQLQHIVEEEGIERRFARHAEMASFVRAWADEYFRVYPERAYLSQTLTVIDKCPKGSNKRIDFRALNAALAERGMQLGDGYGGLKERCFRLAHMGELRMEDMKEITSAIVDILKLG